MKKHTFAIGFIVLISLFACVIDFAFVSAWNSSTYLFAKQKGHAVEAGGKKISSTEVDKGEMLSELTLIAVGDNLIHQQVIKSGKQKDGTYEYKHLYDKVRAVVKEADVAIINQETILSNDTLGYSGYPLFGSPTEIADAAIDAGFNVFLHATNHTMDKKYAGVEHTLSYWSKQKEITVAGINPSGKMPDRIAYIKRNGIKLAILNYTYGLNGLPLPKDKPYLVNLLNDEEQIREDIALAKKNSDFIIVCPHWGVEYQQKPCKEQKEWVDFFVEEGVDLVLGAHPHVLQPVEWVMSKDGTHKMLVYYSLGNFISGQDTVSRMLGGMAKVTLVKENKKVVIKEKELLPVVTHFQWNTKPVVHTTYLLREYTDELARVHSIHRTDRSEFSVESLTNLAEHRIKIRN